MRTENNSTHEQRLYNIERELLEIKQLLQQVLGSKRVTNKPKPESDILNVNEAMVLLGLDRHLIYARSASGDIPSFKVGKQYKYKRQELVKWLDAQEKMKETDVEDFVARYMQKHQLRG